MDNQGILIYDKETGECRQVLASGTRERSLPHNTIYSLLADSKGVMWIGTYKKGIACYAESMYKFALLPIGDITNIAETPSGEWLLGTNDNGLIVWNPRQHTQKNFNSDNGNFESDAIVSILVARDGKVWSVLSGEDWSVSTEAGLPFTGKPIPPMDWPMIVSGICRKMRMDASG